MRDADPSSLSAEDIRGEKGNGGRAKSDWVVMALLVRRFVWLGPLLAAPLLIPPLRHTLAKETAPGFYLDDHFPEFVGNMGWVLCTLVLASVVAALLIRSLRTRAAVVCIVSGAAYFAPLAFGTPPLRALGGHVACC